MNCPFYHKIGACRHGEQCSRVHNRPVVSQSIILKHMYQNLPAAIAMAEGQTVSDEMAEDAQEHFEAFLEAIYMELANYGDIEEIGVADNIGDHLIGTVYVKFVTEQGAEIAMEKLSGRFYAGRVLNPEYCPVLDFSDARCRQYDDAQCSRGGYCNFVHWKHVPRVVKKRLRTRLLEVHPEYRPVERGRAERRPTESRQTERRRSEGRENSIDRRAKIAAWNKQKEQEIDESQL